jgi:hypothetical protein
MSVGSVSGSDSSAEAWAAGTIASAEAHVIANGQPTDGVEPPMTASERAQEAFWQYDPNRPTSAPAPAGGSDGSDGSEGDSTGGGANGVGGQDGRSSGTGPAGADGPRPVPVRAATAGSERLTPEQAATILAENPYAEVFQDERGNYYLDTRNDSGIDVVSQAQLPAPSYNDPLAHVPDAGAVDAPQTPPANGNGEDCPPVGQPNQAGAGVLTLPQIPPFVAAHPELGTLGRLALKAAGWISLITLSGHTSPEERRQIELLTGRRDPSTIGLPEGSRPDHPIPIYPPGDGTLAPGADWEWRGKTDPAGGKGNWTNPGTGESLHPDLNHPPPIGPHWDWKDPSGENWRLFPDGRVEPK